MNTYALEQNEGKPLSLYMKAFLGLSAGGIGALVGTPADLTLIRMQAGMLSLPAVLSHICPKQRNLSLRSLSLYWNTPMLSMIVWSLL